MGVARGLAQFGRAPALGAGGRRFKSCFPDFATLAQWQSSAFVKHRLLVQVQ
ncbi:MAG: hypothetical protein RL411_935 [Bacteroidota bacterium]|jgi:hypothetical protein